MSKPGQLPSHEELHRLLAYYPETGVLTWRVSAGTAQAGAIAGWIDAEGYRRLKIGHRSFAAHRVIWKMVTGRDPVAQIDHANRAKSDNRWGNLREAAQWQNNANKPGRKLGLKGAYRTGRSKSWRAEVKAGGQRIILGRFSSAEEAHAAYCAAVQRLHGPFADLASGIAQQGSALLGESAVIDGK